MTLLSHGGHRGRGGHRGPGKRRAAIVDPWGSGALLAPELRRRGWECFAVCSDAGVAGVLGGGKRPEGLIEGHGEAAVLDHDGDLAAAAAWLRRRRVSLVLAGCETGVWLADQLSAMLGLPGNGTVRSPARRDKALMAAAAARCGLAVPRQTSSPHVDELLAWIDGHGGYPVVVKPPHSLDSEGVTACATPAQVRAAVGAFLGRRNLAGLTNHTAIVQQLLDGEQYAVDTVSLDGRHLLAGVWRYSRPATRPAIGELLAGTALEQDPASRQRHYAAIGSDGKQLLPATDERSRHLFAAVCPLLDALDIGLGPAHSELIWSGTGPLLIEIGARLHGGVRTPLISRLCTGSSQLDRALDAWCDPARFTAALERPYPMRQHGAMVYLMPWRQGILAGYGRLGEMARLPSFVEMFDLAPSGPLERRVAGLVVLIHPDAEIVRQDVARIRAWELDGLYRMTSQPLDPLRPVPANGRNLTPSGRPRRC